MGTKDTREREREPGDGRRKKKGKEIPGDGKSLIALFSLGSESVSRG